MPVGSRSQMSSWVRHRRVAPNQPTHMGVAAGDSSRPCPPAVAFGALACSMQHCDPVVLRRLAPGVLLRTSVATSATQDHARTPSECAGVVASEAGAVKRACDSADLCSTHCSLATRPRRHPRRHSTSNMHRQCTLQASRVAVGRRSSSAVMSQPIARHGRQAERACASTARVTKQLVAATAPLAVEPVGGKFLESCGDALAGTI